MVPAFRGRKNKKDRENVKVFPNIFINMIQFKEEECSFSELANLQIEEYFNSIYIQLKDIGIIDILENMSHKYFLLLIIRFCNIRMILNFFSILSIIIKISIIIYSFKSLQSVVLSFSFRY